MIIYVELNGGFGNHLLEFCAAKIISEIKSVDNIYIKTNYLQSDENSQKKDTRSSLAKIIDKKYFTNTTCYNGLRLTFDNFSTILDNNENLLIYSPCIPFSIISKYKEKIKYEWLSLPKNDKIIINEDDIVISLRLGMGIHEVANVYENIHRLPFTYYKNALNSVKYNRIIICSDNFEDPYIKQFDCYNPIYAKYNTLEQFVLIMNAKKIISSNSTFSIFASVLSDADIIYYPMFASKTMLNEENPKYADILYPKEPREKYILC